MEFQNYIINDLNDDVIKELFGINDCNLKQLKSLYETDISFRDNCFKFFSNDVKNFEVFKRHIDLLIEFINAKKELSSDIINQSYYAILDRTDEHFTDAYSKVFAYTFSGKPIFAKTKNQQVLVKAIANHDLTFAIGPAGTGKTFLAVSMAVQAFKKGEVKKIVLTRPAVEAGENLGFLPGDLKEKVDPYLMPLYDALNDLLGNQQFIKMIERNQIEIIPLAFMRGRTLNEAFVILDEAQNTTNSQMLMFLTRLGKNSKMVINGDITQIDLNIKKADSGLIIATNRLKNIDDIAFVYLNNHDVVRNNLVQKIVEAYND